MSTEIAFPRRTLRIRLLLLARKHPRRSSMEVGSIVVPGGDRLGQCRT